MAEVGLQMILNFALLAVIVFFVVRFMFNTPKYRVRPAEEGFFGGVAVGSGHPDCSRTLPETSEIMGVLLNRIKLEEGPADYREFQLILSKLACLKKDLLSPSGIVEATRYQAFEPAHDREPVAEVCATCLNQTIPARDLDIIFATWRDRGNVLLRKLCTEASLSEVEVKKLEKLYAKAWMDVYDIAKGRCLKTVESQMGPADIGGYEPNDLKELREYDCYYGGW